MERDFPYERCLCRHVYRVFSIGNRRLRAATALDELVKYVGTFDAYERADGKMVGQIG